jgi:hypothetical protein
MSHTAAGEARQVLTPHGQQGEAIGTNGLGLPCLQVADRKKRTALLIACDKNYGDVIKVGFWCQSARRSNI